MKTRPISAVKSAILILALAAIFAPVKLRADGKLQAAIHYDIEIADGQLLLANLKDRINIQAKWGSGDIQSVAPTLKNVVDVLLELHTNANITIAPGLEKVRIGDLKLRSTRLDGELQAIQLASGLKFDCVPARGSDPANPSYLLGALPAEQTRKVDVFNLTPYLQQLGDPDESQVEDKIGRVRELILVAYKELRPDSAEEPRFQFHSGANLLVVIGQPDALEVAQKCINALQQPVINGGFRPPFAAAAKPLTKEQRAIMKKLETIRMDSVAYDGLPLSEIVRNLVEESKKRDPEKLGVNFLVNPNAPATPPATLPPMIDPTTGLPFNPTPPTEAIDINSIVVKISPALVNVRLVDVLDAIVKVADHPIRYSVSDYAVVFSLSTPGAAEERPMLPGMPTR